MYPYLSIRSSLLIISCAKLLHKLVKTLYFELSFQITCILPNLFMTDVILKQLLHVFSSSFKVFSNYKKLKTKATFPEKCFINKSL